MKSKRVNGQNKLIWIILILVILLMLIVLAITLGWFTTTGDAVSNTAVGKVIVNVVRP
jgi:flagellar basal body-associated protein FliL